MKILLEVKKNFPEVSSMKKEEKSSRKGEEESSNRRYFPKRNVEVKKNLPGRKEESSRKKKKNLPGRKRRIFQQEKHESSRSEEEFSKAFSERYFTESILQECLILLNVC
ncbi:hypothetical protein CEXT_434101 [Caerostris extrusa]|uniref:Uncharacterized protein n=1 Tax=Caerostris extrusa TaxID=172846 RepID=A0AAV4N019_CAEEX|nr:hypothetical protein CEXT_434101 [Caerostris extrusa]